MNNIEPRDENRLRHGEWIGYINGQLWYRSNYVHGVMHGLCEGYYDDGRLAYRGYRNMNRMFGYWFYHSNKKYFLCLI